MQTTNFGSTGRQVSRLCFGAMGLNFAFGSFDENTLIDGMNQCADRGINMIDTARIYGDSERIVGRFLKQWQGERPFIATKVSPDESGPNSGWGIPNPMEIAYPKGSVTQSVEASLQALDIDCIDLMQLHQYWAQYENEYWLEELLTLKKQGKIRHIGVSIPDHRHDQAIAIVRSGLVDSVQTIINIFDPLAFDSLIPICRQQGVAVIARCVLDEGGLTGLLTPDTQFESSDFRDGYFSSGPLPEYLRRVEALRAYIPEYAESLTELAIRYVLSHPGVTTATISMHVTEQAMENIAIADKGALPQQVFDDIRRHHRWLLNLYERKYFPR
ncbi:aldo/keto reductase [Pseudomaricurvus alkylphenolicus]|uniref:aldo/keto reductase n=1 Tax=Pseudomaricurvus alkylphenolicus TaxID=1306991 RepID=UPI0014248F67|nr:aldo/keto reductase [Pseudomaricurvus alkylphenolicus]NIB38210.1 aldo/keto reductase [Pseudomaricurvus alkylphenolicus]